MPNFKHSPHCILATLVTLEPDVMVGNRIGAWAGVGPHGEVDLSAEELRQRGHAIEVRENGAGLYALRNPGESVRKYEIDYRERVVSFEDRDPMELEEFLSSAIRVAADGRYLCSFAEPLYRQQQACTEAGAGGLMHRQDLQGLADIARDNGFSANAGMYDIVASGIEDDVPYLQTIQNMMAGRRLTESSRLFDLLEADGIPIAAWHEIVEMPQYGIDQVRAIFRMYMSRYVETFPIERILRIDAPAGVNLREALDQSAELISEDPPFEGQNIIRGYRTSPVRHYRAEGADVILFSDPMGEYAYSWPSQEPTPAPGLRA